MATIASPIVQPAALRRRAQQVAAAAALLSGCACGPAFAADSAADTEAVILRPLTLVKTADLEFGSMVPGAVGGTVTINAATNARTSAGGVVPVGGGFHRATFQGAAAIGMLVTVTGSNTATLARVGGGAPAMTATLTRVTAGGVTVVTLPILGTVTRVSGPTQTFHVGGTLTVPANQAAGDYVGTFTLTVNYL